MSNYGNTDEHGNPPFHVLAADPPWKFDDNLPGETRGAARQYECLSVAELAAFALPPLADDAVLFLWRVASMVPEAYRIVEAWGFTPKTEIVWQKLTATGKKHFGMGRLVRASHETAIVATRGRYSSLVKSRATRSTFEAPTPTDDHGRVIHSAKPEAFYDLVEELVSGPYVELFSRRQRPGWTNLGDQSNRFSQLTHKGI